MLVNAALGVLNGDMDLDRAVALHKLSKNITESLYPRRRSQCSNTRLDANTRDGKPSIGDTTQTKE